MEITVFFLTGRVGRGERFSLERERETIDGIFIHIDSSICILEAATASQSSSVLTFWANTVVVVGGGGDGDGVTWCFIALVANAAAGIVRVPEMKAAEIKKTPSFGCLITIHNKIILCLLSLPSSRAAAQAQELSVKVGMTHDSPASAKNHTKPNKKDRE